jgi:uncharacterized protein DUF5681
MDPDSAGYKRPPKMTQFKKGHSGNPKGRPKGARSLKTDLAKLMEKRVRIREDGEQRLVSGQELMLLKLFEKAAKGDIRASTQIFGMLMKIDAHDTQQTDRDGVTDNDRAIVEDFLRRNSHSNKDEVDS